MLVRFNKTTIVGGDTYSPEDGDVDIANDLADQVVAGGDGVIVGLGGRSKEAAFAFDGAGNVTGLVGPDGTVIKIVSGEIATASGSATSLATGYTVGNPATAANMTAEVVDTDGALLDLANDYVVVPADATHVRVSANVLFAANATGKRYVALEQYFETISTWTAVSGYYEERAALSSGATPISFTASLAPLTPAQFTRLRLGVGQDSGGAINCTLTGVSFEFLRIV